VFPVDNPIQAALKTEPGLANLRALFERGKALTPGFWVG